MPNFETEGALLIPVDYGKFQVFKKERRVLHHKYRTASLGEKKYCKDMFSIVFEILTVFRGKDIKQWESMRDLKINKYAFNSRHNFTRGVKCRAINSS